MFTELYLKTTNPEFRLVDFTKPDVLFPIIISAIVHAIVYLIFINLGYFIFMNRFLSNSMNLRVFSILILIIFVGYIGRVLHVKEIYKAYGHKHEKAMKHVNHHYNSWIFIG